MTIRINNISKLKNNISFTHNMLFEMILFLSLLAKPNDFTHKTWAIKQREGLLKEDLKTIHFWGGFDCWLFFIDIMIKNDLLPLKKSSLFLNYIKTMPDEVVLNSLWETPDIWQKANEKHYRKFDSANYKELLSSPNKSIENLKTFLLKFYRENFSSYSQTIELLIAEEINAKLHSLTKFPLDAFFVGLSHKFSVQDDTLIIDGWHDKSFLGGQDLEKIVLIPQIFSSPYLVINYKTFQNILFIGYPIQHSPFLGEMDISHEEVEYFANSFRILGEPTRLKILLSLYNEPACNRDLATKMNLSRPTISKHIARLRLHNFISGKEIDGNRTQYSLGSNRIIDILKLMGFFSQE